MLGLFERREPIDIVTVAEELERGGELDTIGGRAYLSSLSNLTPTTAAWPGARHPSARRAPAGAGAHRRGSAGLGRSHGRDQHPVGIGTVACTGRALVVDDPGHALDLVEPGDVVITQSTCPSWNVVLAHAGAIVTTSVGVLSHAAILARELGIVAVLGDLTATTRFTTSMTVTVDPVGATVGPAPAGTLPRKPAPPRRCCPTRAVSPAAGETISVQNRVGPGDRRQLGPELLWRPASTAPRRGD